MSDSQSVLVVLRVRPLNTNEKKLSNFVCLKVSNDNKSL